MDLACEWVVNVHTTKFYDESAVFLSMDGDIGLTENGEDLACLRNL